MPWGVAPEPRPAPDIAGRDLAPRAGSAFDTVLLELSVHEAEIVAAALSRTIDELGLWRTDALADARDRLREQLAETKSLAAKRAGASGRKS